MKSNAAVRVVNNNSYNSKEFTIQASGKMFHMVISGLYSDKPKSITREIWSNAYDAHAMVGKTDVPFEVTFPTALTPTFTCRDFGPGIAHEDMEGFYTVLGHSTKEDTNAAVGKWGVGRMSPMSYTDTFSVVSRHKGMIAYYSVQLGPDGSPQLHVLAPPAPTDEADGLEVSFPVKRGDIFAFQQAAELVSYGFSVPPRVTNSQDKQFLPIKKVFEGDGYYIYEDSRMSGAYAQMGCVIYPIPSNMVSRLINIVYQFDIGDLEVTASREALSFGPNDPTEAAIKSKQKVVEEVLWQSMQDQIEAQPTLFKAARIMPSLRRWVRYGAAEFKYKGGEVPKFWDLNKYKSIEISCGYRGYRQNIAGWTQDKTLEVAKNYKIFVQDLSDKKANVRVATRLFQRVDKYNYYVWIKANLSNPEEKAELDKLLGEVDYPVHYVKDLPDTGPKKTKRTAVTVSRLVKGRQERWGMDDTEFAKGGYYHPMSNNNYPSIYEDIGPLMKPVFGMEHLVLVPKTLWKKFEGASQWKPIEPALKEFVKKNAEGARKELGNRYNFYPINKLVTFADIKGPVGDFARKIKGEAPRLLHLDLDRNTWNSLLRYVDLPEINDLKVKVEYEKILDEYPLLTLYNGSNLTEAFKDYLAAKE